MIRNYYPGLSQPILPQNFMRHQGMFRVYACVTVVPRPGHDHIFHYHNSQARQFCRRKFINCFISLIKLHVISVEVKCSLMSKYHQRNWMSDIWVMTMSGFPVIVLKMTLRSNCCNPACLQIFEWSASNIWLENFRLIWARVMGTRTLPRTMLFHCPGALELENEAKWI